MTSSSMRLSPYFSKTSLCRLLLLGGSVATIATPVVAQSNSREPLKGEVVTSSAALLTNPSTSLGSRVISSQIPNVGPGAVAPAVTAKSPSLPPLPGAPAALNPTGVAKALAPANPEQRSEREKLAPAVMTLQPKVDQQALEMAVFNEAVKRLRNVETREPARALAEYRRFLVGRSPVPAVGVRAGIKVSQMRQRLEDVEGALLTCDLLAKKYADEPSSILLSYQKANVLMSEKRLAEASECVEKALPQVLALGPAHYQEASTFLLKLAQANLDNGDKDGKQRASDLCLDVEQIYLKWLKGGTIPHTWQLFEALQVKYQEAEDSQRAQELLPKVADTLLQMTPTNKNIEGADVSLTAARWLTQQGHVQEAQALYEKVPGYGNGFVSQIVPLEQAKSLISNGNRIAAHKLLRSLLTNYNNRVRITAMLMLGNDLYSQGDLKGAEESFLKARSFLSTSSYLDTELKDYSVDINKMLDRVDMWKKRPIYVTPKEIKLNKNSKDEKRITFRIKVYTYQDIPLVVKNEFSAVKVREVVKRDLENSNQRVEVRREFVIEVPTQASSQEKSSEITSLIVTSPDFAEFEQRITLRADDQD